MARVSAVDDFDRPLFSMEIPKNHIYAIALVAPIFGGSHHLFEDGCCDFDRAAARVHARFWFAVFCNRIYQIGR